MLNETENEFPLPVKLPKSNFEHILEKHSLSGEETPRSKEIWSLFPVQLSREEIRGLIDVALSSVCSVRELPEGKKIEWWPKNIFVAYLIEGDIKQYMRLVIMGNIRGEVFTLYPSFGFGVTVWKRGRRVPIESQSLLPVAPVFWNKNTKEPINLLVGNTQSGFIAMFNHSSLADLKPIEREQLIWLALTEGKLHKEDNDFIMYYRYEIPFAVWRERMPASEIIIKVNRKNFNALEITEVAPLPREILKNGGNLGKNHDGGVYGLVSGTASLFNPSHVGEGRELCLIALDGGWLGIARELIFDRANLAWVVYLFAGPAVFVLAGLRIAATGGQFNPAWFYGIATTMFVTGCLWTYCFWRWCVLNNYESVYNLCPLKGFRLFWVISFMLCNYILGVGPQGSLIGVVLTYLETRIFYLYLRKRDKDSRRMDVSAGGDGGKARGSVLRFMLENRCFKDRPITIKDVKIEYCEGTIRAEMSNLVRLGIVKVNDTERPYLYHLILSSGVITTIITELSAEEIKSLHLNPMWEADFSAIDEKIKDIRKQYSQDGGGDSEKDSEKGGQNIVRQIQDFMSRVLKKYLPRRVVLAYEFANKITGESFIQLWKIHKRELGWLIQKFPLLYMAVNVWDALFCENEGYIPAAIIWSEDYGTAHRTLAKLANNFGIPYFGEGVEEQRKRFHQEVKEFLMNARKGLLQVYWQADSEPFVYIIYDPKHMPRPDSFLPFFRFTLFLCFSASPGFNLNIAYFVLYVPGFLRNLFVF